MITDPPPLGNKEEDDFWPVCVLKCGKRIFSEELAVSDMLRAEELIVAGLKDGDIAALLVRCSDMFAWGCSDFEPLKNAEIENLWNHWQADNRFGTAVWCMKQRKRMPQKPVERDIRKGGIWDLDAMDLAAN